MIDEWAGILGLDPGPLTMRQMFVMVNSRLRWVRGEIADLLCLFNNIHRDTEERPRPYGSYEFNHLLTEEDIEEIELAIMEQEQKSKDARPRYDIKELKTGICQAFEIEDS